MLFLGWYEARLIEPQAPWSVWYFPSRMERFPATRIGQRHWSAKNGKEQQGNHCPVSKFEALAGKKPDRVLLGASAVSQPGSRLAGSVPRRHLWRHEDSGSSGISDRYPGWYHESWLALTWSQF